MRFYLYEEQGGGCDYTIACGKRLRLLDKATTMEEAIAIAKSSTTGRYGEEETMICVEGDFAIKEARILAVAEEFVVDIQALRSQRKAQRAAKEAQEREENERQQYEKLRQKFEGGK